MLLRLHMHFEVVVTVDLIHNSTPWIDDIEALYCGIGLNVFRFLHRFWLPKPPKI